jgi:esterase/lipase superfamily enzyme
MTNDRKKYCRCAWLVLSLLLTAHGCHNYLVPTPTLLQQQDPRQVYASCPPSYQTPEASVLYATDRVSTGSYQNPGYGHERARNLVYGVASVKLDPSPTWMELIEASTSAKRNREFALALAEVREFGHFRTRPDHAPSHEVALAGAAQAGAAPENRFHELLDARLAQTAHKDVFIFVHGFNNTFEQGVSRIAEVWHFMGRVGVPISYSWPAGMGGLRGYAYDRESGEYTVSHLRQFLKIVASHPGVERVHILAHSRGTDIAITALRELHLEYQARGLSTQAELKLENLVLAAPDIDEDVFIQRTIDEHLLTVARRTTIYASSNDRAIETADLVFASKQRLGSLGAKDVSPKIRQAMTRLANAHFIECKVASTWAINHDYVFDNPAALSDLILVLRDRRDPGAANGRPLRNPSPGVWELAEDYLK